MANRILLKIRKTPHQWDAVSIDASGVQVTFVTGHGADNMAGLLFQAENVRLCVPCKQSSFNDLLVEYVDQMLSEPSLIKVSVDTLMLNQLINEFEKVEPDVLAELEKDVHWQRDTRYSKVKDQLRNSMDYGSEMVRACIASVGYLGQKGNDFHDVMGMSRLGGRREKVPSEEAVPVGITSSGPKRKPFQGS